MEKRMEKLIKEAIGLGFAWACNECHWDPEECPIAKVAKKFDENFEYSTFCRFDIEKVVKGLIEYLKNQK